MLVEPILAADFIEILARGIPVILFILWLIGQAMSERQKQGKVAPRQERQERPVPAQPQPQARRERNEIEDEIDAFLRRASEKRGQPESKRERDETVILVPPKREGNRSQAGIPPRQPERRRPAAASGTSQPAKERSVRSAPPVQRPLPPTPKPLVLQSGRPLQASGLGTLRSSLAPSASQLASDRADELSLADEKIETHLHSVFDHQVGRLQHRETTPTRRVSGSPLAESVAKMLSDPQGVQQLIVANEILRRPEL